MPIIQTTKTLAKRDLYDHYPTPRPHVRAALSLLPSGLEPGCILDPGAGTGIWGIEARVHYPHAVIVGTDIRPLSRPRAYDFWFTGGFDFLLNRERDIFDLIIGNPPFGKRGTRKDRLAAEKFVRRSLALLRNDGWIAFLLPLTFLAGQRRGTGLYKDLPPIHIVVCSDRPSFTGDGKTDNTEYMIAIWQKGYRGKPDLDWVSSADFADVAQLRLQGGF